MYFQPFSEWLSERVSSETPFEYSADSESKAKSGSDSEDSGDSKDPNKNEISLPLRMMVTSLSASKSNYHVFESAFGQKLLQNQSFRSRFVLLHKHHSSFLPS